jgi:hypothetical protein
MLTYLGRLQLSSMDRYEVISILTPNWQMNIVYSFFHLGKTKVMLLDIDEKLGQVIKLRDKLAYIRHFGSHAKPTNFEGIEQSITEIKLSSL